MRISKLPTLFLALLACSTAAAQAFDYDDIADGRFRPAQLAGIRPTADGEHYTTIRDGNIFRHRYAVDDAGTALLPAAAEEGAVALDSLDRATGTWCDAGSRRLDIADYAIAPDGGVLVADGAEPIYRHSFTTRYLYYDGRRLREILLGIPSPRDAVFTPDGRNIVFSSRNNLYVYNIERQGTRQITRDGRWNETINGTTDWVYEEEFGFTRAFAVSPDSRRIAYLRFDESRVPLFEMMRYDGALYNRAYDFKYPKAGDANSVVTLHVFDLETGRTTKIDTGADTTQYIPRIGWTPRGELWYETRDRRQQQIVFRRLAADALTAPQAEQQTVYRERSPRYVAHETDRSFRWIDGGRRFLIMQETATGWMHLYLGEPGEPLRALTEGRWEVTGIVGADDRAVYYTSTERSPLERNLYAVDYKGRHKRLLTPDKGFHTIAPSAGMRYYISTFSSADDPGRVEICDARGRTVRTVADNNYIVMETNAQGIGWDARTQFPPYDNQLRQNVYAHYASGANMVEYWHWSTLHYGQETYWRGVLGHDLQPNRIYKEFTTTAKELERIGSHIVNLKKKNRVAILYSHDSYHALGFMPYTYKSNYPIDMVHKALYFQNIETDIIPCDKTTDFSGYDMLVIPPLYVATDQLLLAIDEFVQSGGHVVMMHKSGYCNEHSAVRATLAPGPLRKACGFHYQEFSTIGDLSLKDNPFQLEGKNQISDWYEFLIPETATPLAYAEHPFFGKWPVVTENKYGKGKLTYIGAYPSQELLNAIVRKAAIHAGIISSESDVFPIIQRSGINKAGKAIRYFFNYSSESKEITHNYPTSKELISGKTVKEGDHVTLPPWGVLIMEVY